MNNVRLLKTFALLGNQTVVFARYMVALCKKKNIDYNEQTIALFVYQFLPIARRRTRSNTYTPLLPYIQSDNPFKTYITNKSQTQVVTQEHSDILMHLWNLFAALKEFDEQPSWESNPCRVYIRELLKPLNLDIKPRLIDGIALLIE